MYDVVNTHLHVINIDNAEAVRTGLQWVSIRTALFMQMNFVSAYAPWRNWDARRYCKMV